MSCPTRFTTLAVLCLGAAACGPNEQKLAEESIARADRFVTAAQANGGKILPDAAKRLGDSLKVAKELAAAGKFRDANNKAVDVANGAIEMAKSLPRSQVVLDSTFKFISWAITVPYRQTVTKVKQYQDAGRVPAGMTKPTWDSLRNDIATWEATWKSATDLHAKGEIGLSTAKAEQLRASVLGAMKLLGIK